MDRPPSHGTAEDDAEPVVLVLDDDRSMRDALQNLLRSVGLRVQVFASTSELMRGALPDAPSCLVLDVRLPEASGIEFQAALREADIHIPVIFITGFGDIPMSVQAMKAGAVDFLTKPFRQQDLIDAVNRALVADRKRRVDRKRLAAWRNLYDSLTGRERQIMALVSAGVRNKSIAADLGISEITVKVHRVHLMRKMGARSLADLVRIADVLAVDRDPRV
jgi:FixJ family two-component response regulator